MRIGDLYLQPRSRERSENEQETTPCDISRSPSARILTSKHGRPAIHIEREAAQTHKADSQEPGILFLESPFQSHASTPRSICQGKWQSALGLRETLSIIQSIPCVLWRCTVGPEANEGHPSSLHMQGAQCGLIQSRRMQQS